MSIKQPSGKILRPGEVLKVKGEGMPIKKTDHRGDLYLVIKVEFPEDGWIKDEKTISTLKQALPKSEPSIKPDVVDEVAFEDGDLDDFGGDEAGNDDDWEDDDEVPHTAQCATQ